MEVEFSHEMFTNFTNPENRSEILNLTEIFNTSNTNITIIPNSLRSIDEPFDASKLSLIWSPFFYGNKTLKIFLNITNPAEVSSEA